ncbi:MAG: hypothetical protein VW338_05715 [Rhodospirillaceae bacterium]
MTDAPAATARLARRLLCVMLLALTGCAETETAVGLDGSVRLFSDDPAQPVFGRASDWVELGKTAAMAPAIVTEGGRTILEISARGENAALIRRLDAPLLAMPFLFWDWSAVDGAPDHPVRLVVGFEDRRTAPARTFNWGLGPAEPPPFSRSLALVWGASALQRGSIEVAASGEGGRPHARYVVRGGRENGSRWWPEHLDLSQLHAAAWPNVDMAASRVVFVGISTAAGAGGSMRLAGLRLSR